MPSPPSLGCTLSVCARPAAYLRNPPTACKCYVVPCCLKPRRDHYALPVALTAHSAVQANCVRWGGAPPNFIMLVHLGQPHPGFENMDPIAPADIDLSTLDASPGSGSPRAEGSSAAAGSDDVGFLTGNPSVQQWKGQVRRGHTCPVPHSFLTRASEGVLSCLAHVHTTQSKGSMQSCQGRCCHDPCHRMQPKLSVLHCCECNPLVASCALTPAHQSCVYAGSTQTDHWPTIAPFKYVYWQCRPL